MGSLYVLILSVLTLSASSGAAECESGWVAYKDELCIKAFTSLLTYEEANAFCISQGTETSKSTMVMVKDADLQILLASYTQDIYNTIWLGSKFDEETGQYIWDDGEPLTYTNWDDGYPRNSTESACVELRPVNAKVDNNTEGKWADVNCQKRNIAICQMTSSWTLQDAINEIIRLRKEMRINVVPVGSIYIEYFNQPSPVELWPHLSWEDVSSAYAGLFFRSSGGGSETWGVTQTECSPRITRSEHQISTDDAGVNPTTIPSNGWSEYGRTGEIYDGERRWWERQRFYTEGCEVRPINQAIRIWKRTG